MIISVALRSHRHRCSRCFFTSCDPSLAESIDNCGSGPFTPWSRTNTTWTKSTARSSSNPFEGISRFILWKGIDEARYRQRHRQRAWAAWFAAGVSLFRQLQSGSIRNYATWVLAGSLLVIFVLGLVGGGTMNMLALRCFLPLAGFFVVCLLPRDSKARHSSSRWPPRLLTFFVSLGLISPAHGTPRSHFTSVDQSPWITSPGLQIRFHLGVDGINLWLVMLTALPASDRRLDLGHHDQRPHAKLSSPCCCFLNSARSASSPRLISSSFTSSGKSLSFPCI